MINLITSFFVPKETERQNELLTCLKQNINCKDITKIYLFIEKKDDIDFLQANINPKQKIQLILWNKQPTYADYLKLANQLQGEICMISNADIWLKKCDEELINLLHGNPKIAYSLTRYDYDKSNNLKLCASLWRRETDVGCFDSFILKSPININYALIDHIQNRPGSEHIFKTELEHTGIKFHNPCYNIIIVHEHLSNVRTYTMKDDLLWDFDASGGRYGLYKYDKCLVQTPPSHVKSINNHIKERKKKEESRKIFSTVSSLFS
jgi:hypothetical protein